MNTLGRCQLLYRALVACAFLLLVSNLTGRPTGYLHSWNQITTLALIRQLAQDPATILAPREVVARVTTATQTVDQKFLNYEEFPLYHLLAAQLGSLVGSVEMGARVISIFFTLFGLYGARRLIDPLGTVTKQIFTLLYLFSFIVLFYGQAIMSDCAMAACGIWSIERAVQWQRSQRTKTLLLSALFLIVSTLFKSYGAIFLVPVVLIVFTYSHTLGSRVVRLIALSLTLTPVIAWHLYSLTQSGNQEVASHSLTTKLYSLTSSAFYSALAKHLLHIPGIAVAILALFGFFYWLKKTPITFDSISTSLRQLPLWLTTWLLALIPYLIITADKIAPHEYYLIPFAVPVLTLCAMGVTQLLQSTRLHKVVYGLILLAVTYQCGWLVHTFYKATRENPDVRACAQIVTQHVPAGARTATWSDLARYNSVNYYSEREGLHVEEDNFPLSRYRDDGARYLLVALSPKELSSVTNWISAQGTALAPLSSRDDLLDFKGKRRACFLYSIAQ